MKGSVRTASEDEYGRSGLFSWTVRVIMQPQSKELFTTYGEVSESFTFLGCRSQNQTHEYKQI